MGNGNSDSQFPIVARFCSFRLPMLKAMFQEALSEVGLRMAHDSSLSRLGAKPEHGPLPR